MGGRTVTVTWGNQRRRSVPRVRPKRLHSGPSMRIGTTGAPARSATKPGPSWIFISPPVQPTRPLGKNHSPSSPGGASRAIQARRDACTGPKAAPISTPQAR